MSYLTREDIKKKENFNLEECRGRNLKLYQCPPVQFSLAASVILTVVFIIASKVVLNAVSVVLILLIFGLILSLAGWLIVKKYRARSK